jgi:hypothetical protein
MLIAKSESKNIHDFWVHQHRMQNKLIKSNNYCFLFLAKFSKITFFNESSRFRFSSSAICTGCIQNLIRFFTTFTGAKNKIPKQKNAKKIICNDSHGVCVCVHWRDTGQKQPNVPPPRVLLRAKNNLNLKKCKRRIRRYQGQSAPKKRSEKTKSPPSHNGIQIHNSQWLLKFSFWYRSTLAASTNVCRTITEFEISILTNRILLKMIYFPS